MPNGQVVTPQAVQATTNFSPELQTALRNVRDHAGGEYMVAVFHVDHPPNDTRFHLHLTAGPNWKRAEWYLKAFELFVAQHHRITPEMLGAVQQGGPAAVVFPPTNLNPVI